MAWLRRQRTPNEPESRTECDDSQRCKQHRLDSGDADVTPESGPARGERTRSTTHRQPQKDDAGEDPQPAEEESICRVALSLEFSPPLANGFALPATVAQYPEWYFGLVSFVPSSAYQSAVSAAVSGATTGAGLAGMDAVYLEPWFGFVWLALWGTVPLALAYAKFTNADLCVGVDRPLFVSTPPPASDRVGPGPSDGTPSGSTPSKATSGDATPSDSTRRRGYGHACPRSWRTTRSGGR